MSTFRFSLVTTMFRLSVAAVLIGLASTSLSLAGAINIDFNAPGGASGTYVGTAVAPDSGTIWNGISSTGASALVNSAGVSASVTFTLPFAAFYDGASPTPALLKPALMNDYIFQDPAFPDTNTPFLFHGLVPGGKYDLYIYSQNAGYGNTTCVFGIDGVSETPWATNAGNVSGFVLGTNYVRFSDVTATGGTIYGWIYGVGGGLAANGIQLVGTIPIPEPSSFWLAMIAVGLLGLPAYAKRN